MERPKKVGEGEPYEVLKVKKSERLCFRPSRMVKGVGVSRGPEGESQRSYCFVRK